LHKDASLKLVFFTEVPRVAATGSAETDRIAWDEIHNHSSMPMRQYGHLDHCIGFHEQRKHLQKVPLQQKGGKTLP